MARPLPDPSLPWSIPMAAVELIANAEGLRLKAYRCPAGVLTCGWGETDGVTAHTVWTKAQADQRLCDSTAEYASRVLEMCTDEPTENELGAMVSLAYNIGLDALRKSSVLKAHNRGDAQSASRAFGLWNKARVNGVLQPLKGLTARRAAEASLYLQPPADDTQARMPQAVESVGTLSESPTAVTGVASVAVGGLTLFSEAGQYLGTFGGFASQAKAVLVDTLGIPSGALFPALLVLVGGIVIWRRFGQRIKGWA